MPINRNTEAQFAMNAQVNIPRSQFDCSHELLTTFNVGELIPIELTEVVAGDTWQYKTHSVVRMQPMVTSPFDVLELDTYYFYAPMRILWDHFPEFLGENKNAPWIQNTEYSIPQLVFAKQGGPGESAFRPGTLCDYFGIPPAETGGGFSVSALPFRMYAMIVNEFFRDENLQNPVEIDTGDSNTIAFNYDATESEMRDYVTALTRGGYPFIAGKLSDYFTRALPGPQRGPDTYVLPSPYVYFGEPRNVTDVFNNHEGNYNYISAVGNNKAQPLLNPDATLFRNGGNHEFQPNNWMVENPTINQLRIAFQVQKYYEALGRSGSRYREIMRGIYGVQLSDKTVQIPEYLGGNRQTIFSNQVLSTVGTEDAPQGSVSGYVLKSESHGDFIASFEEPGYIIGLAVVRYHHKYQNGINRLWSRKDKFDFYAPQFANIGEQPILNKEIYLYGQYTSLDVQDDEVFGYQEAWADYRYKPSIVTGEMRSNISNSLDSWHFADDYDTLPQLGDSWIKEDKGNVDRSLAVQSSVSNQLFADFWFECKATRPMPVHSIPGLVDHF